MSGVGFSWVNMFIAFKRLQLYFLTPTGMYNRDRIHHTFTKLLNQYGYVVKENIGRERSIVHLFHPEDILMVYGNDGPHPSRLSNRIMERYRRERPHQYSSAGLGPR